MMIQKKAEKRAVNGILLLNKPSGISSNHALQRVKRLFHAKKAGHTGSLDPLASGMLPVCLGEATKFSQYLLMSDKTYIATAKLGVSTDTLDAEGEVLAEREVPALNKSDIETYLLPFRGDIEQIPPMYSALKHQGQRLYKLARQNISVERPARPVTIHQLDCLALEGDTLKLLVHCSKGTYIRTLADDIGEAMGCGAHITALHRVSVGDFKEAGMVSMEQLEASEDLAALDAFLLPITQTVTHLPRITLDAVEAQRCQFGQRLTCPATDPQGLVQLYTDTDTFIGIGEISETTLSPKRLLQM